jgi:hypothetical protein
MVASGPMVTAGMPEGISSLDSFWWFDRLSLIKNFIRLDSFAFLNGQP